MKKTDLFEIRENQTLNIGLKVFLSDKIYASHLLKLHFGLSMTWSEGPSLLGAEMSRNPWTGVV